MSKPILKLQTTTLWDYPSQHYKRSMEPESKFPGATPAYVIWNLLMRFTKPNDLIIDPMCGSGTTMDVARELKRRVIGYDISPVRKDIFRADARKTPLENEKADFVFIDPPYSDHIHYSDSDDCIGKLSALKDGYYKAMQSVINEIYRIMRFERFMAVYVSDSYEKDKPFMPIGFRLFSMLCDIFTPVDIITVARHNSTLLRNNWHRAAAQHNYFLRGFNYLFIMYKTKMQDKKQEIPDRRDIKEKEKQVREYNIKKS
ncbi:MAG: DNA methylase [Spirochaetes bacterium]|nr:DNA methylase [Spirochaetota bacterium]